MSNNTEALIAEMKAAAEKATQGRWTLSNENKMVIRDEDGVWIATSGYFDNPVEVADGYHMATSSPDNVLALIAALELLERENIMLKQSCENDPRIHEIIDLKERVAELEGYDKEQMLELYRRNAQISRLRNRVKELETSHAQVIQARDHYKSLVSASQLTVKLPSINDGEVVISECNPDVFENGVSACLVVIPKEVAEVICRGISAASGCKVDWHYIGGRVHIKAICAAGGTVHGDE